MAERVAELKQAYREKETDVKRSVRQDKRQLLDRKATQAEEAARTRDSRTLYQISKSLGGDGRWVEKAQ